MTVNPITAYKRSSGESFHSVGDEFHTPRILTVIVYPEDGTGSIPFNFQIVSGSPWGSKEISNSLEDSLKLCKVGIFDANSLTWP
ncbi:Uncharacterized protein TCM_011539 [Theobroma cacao]|uniref:Uncharacterized protein n=1 Tax=Theobroma cacao TaxID=3641 RepID=A0A061EHF7_THECC|nr:Uncharacterized protein TCM_011539 [Theobroma cacao]